MFDTSPLASLKSFTEEAGGNATLTASFQMCGGKAALTMLTMLLKLLPKMRQVVSVYSEQLLLNDYGDLTMVAVMAGSTEAHSHVMLSSASAAKRQK